MALITPDIPPYFLSNNGLSIQSGKIVSVNKGKWDKSEGFEYVNDFNRKWLTPVRDKMKDDATIWISGTMHNIFSVGQILTELGFKILNVITWEKTNPPPIDLWTTEKNNEGIAAPTRNWRFNAPQTVLW